MARVSIKDVAEQAGVSTATVSHVINQTRFVREETRQKVLEAIEALNYQPSAIARGLATNSTQTIGLIISDIANPFFMAVARGVQDEIHQHGYHTIFCNTDEDPEREDEYLRLLSARQIDGLIIAPTGAHSERLLRMAATGLPIVLLDRETPDIEAPLIGVDNEGGGVSGDAVPHRVGTSSHCDLGGHRDYLNSSETIRRLQTGLARGRPAGQRSTCGSGRSAVL